jgi:hypothetical protein
LPRYKEIDWSEVSNTIHGYAAEEYSEHEDKRFIKHQYQRVVNTALDVACNQLSGPKSQGAFNRTNSWISFPANPAKKWFEVAKRISIAARVAPESQYSRHQLCRQDDSKPFELIIYTEVCLA